MSAIFVEPDPFYNRVKDVAAYIPSFTEDGKAKREYVTSQAYFKEQNAQSVAELQAVSRPLTGVSVKPNTPAFVQVVREDGTIVKIFNALGAGMHTELSGDYHSGSDQLNDYRNSEKPKAVNWKTQRDARKKALDALVNNRFGWSATGMLGKAMQGGNTGPGNWDIGVDEN